MFHDAVLTEEQQMLRKVLTQMAKDYPQSYFLKKMRANEYPQEFWSALAQNGFLGLEADAAFGGSGMKLADLMVLLHGLSLNGMVSYQLIGQLLAGHALTAHGTPEQQKTHLPAVIAGTRFTAATIEDVTGADAFACATTAKPTANGYVLSGRKLCVAGGGEAAYLLVTARVAPAAPGAPQAGLGVFIVPAGAAGITVHERELGMRVAETREARAITGDVFCDVTLGDVAVPKAALLGAADGSAVLDLLSHTLLMLAASAAGAGERVIDLGVEYAKQRVLYTEPIAAYQAIQHPMVRAKTDVEMAKLFIERAVDGYAETTVPADRLSYASLAKQLATEAATSSFDIAMQSHGGSSFDREVGIITHWPLAMMARMWWFNNDEILVRFGDALLTERSAATGAGMMAELMK